MPFLFIKALSFLPFGGFLKNPKVLIGIILIALIAFGIWKWKDSIKTAAYNSIFAEQSEQHFANQRRELDRREALILESQRAAEEARIRRTKLVKEIEAARERARNVDPEKDGTVAPVLSEALEFIRSRQGSSEPAGPSLGDRLDSAIDSSSDALKGAQEATGEAIESGKNSAIEAWKNLGDGE
jgi:hypothetical protein